MTDLPLRSYQEHGALMLLERKHAALWYEMGTGKTLTALAALTPDQLPAVVCAPPLVARDTWPAEVGRWRPDLRVSPVVGTPAQRARALQVEADVYTVGYSVLAKHVKDLRALRPRTVILDEASMLRHWQTNRTKAATALCKGVEYVWQLTGTPMSGSLEDVYAQARILDGGERFRTLGAFRTAYLEVVKRDPRTGVPWLYRERPGARDQVLERMRDIVHVVRTESALPDLPEEVVVPHGYRLTAAETRVYDELAQEAVAVIGDQSVYAPTAAAVTGKLRQVLAGGVLGGDGSTVEVSRRRLDLLVGLLRQALGEDLEPRRGEGVIVWYAFVWEREAVRGLLGDRVVLPSQPGGLARFQAGEVPVLLAHPASAGHGLNLAEAGHQTVWLSLPWSLEHYEQANARFHRGGQRRRVVHHVVEARTSDGRPTVDAAVQKALRQKSDLSEHVKLALAAG